MDLTLKQLKVFVMVAQEASITLASEKLFLSKAAVSLAITELEKRLGQSFFNRVNNRLLLNDNGKRLLPLADEMLIRKKEIEAIFDTETFHKFPLKVGASDTIGSSIAPFLLRDFQRHSGFEGHMLFVGNTSKVCDLIKNYALDVGLIEGALQSNEFNKQKWLRDAMYIVCHADSIWSSYESLNDLNDSPWILREQGSGTREYFMQHVASQLVDWRLVQELSSANAIISSIRAGLGLTCISGNMLDNMLREDLIKLPITLKPRQYWIVTRKEKYEGVVLKQFLGFCGQWKGQ